MNRPDGKRRFARNAAIAATLLAIWGALALLFAAPLALTSQVSWRQAVSFGASFWALWLVFLPAAAWLAFRFPFERKNLFRNVALHVLACLLIVRANRSASLLIPRLTAAPQNSELPGRLPSAKPVRLGPPGAFGVLIGFRAALDVLVYWSLVGVGQAILNFRSSQERERRAIDLEARLTRAQLQALRMQINPHFLFNTLNSITALVYVDPRAADEMLGDLSGLLRRSLDSMEAQEIPLGQELDFIAGYIRIEQKRFGERLRVELNVPAELRKALVPALLLQPLVENAIRHGIEPRRGPGLILIEAKQEGQRLHLLVGDDGRGLAGAELNPSGRPGIGLANTQARLLGLYGSNQSFSFGRAEPQGCRVDIQLPLHWEPVPIATVAKELAG